MGKKLYCGNLSYNTTSSDLDQIFGEFGTVKSADVIMDRDTGRSKGFGFVEMNSDQEAMAAIEGVNGKEHDGRTLTVNEARPREERGGGGGWWWSRRRRWWSRRLRRWWRWRRRSRPVLSRSNSDIETIEPRCAVRRIWVFYLASAAISSECCGYLSRSTSPSPSSKSA